MWTPSSSWCATTTAPSKLVHDYIAGYEVEDAQGNRTLVAGKCALFRNFDPDGVAIPRMRTLLIDSQQLESGEAIAPEFREAAKEEIQRFKAELIERHQDAQAGDNIDDATLLREVMNTVGRKGALGEGIRCVVSVSMLTEGGTANNRHPCAGRARLRHPASVRAGDRRALRRQSYRLQEDAGSRWNMPTCSAFPSISPPSRWSPSPASPTTWCASIPRARSGTRARSASRAWKATARRCRRTCCGRNFRRISTLELTPDLVAPRRRSIPASWASRRT